MGRQLNTYLAHAACAFLPTAGCAVHTLSTGQAARAPIVPLTARTPGSGQLDAQDERTRFTLETTSKGNGWLHLPGVRVHIWDVHDNGEVYAGGWLHLFIAPCTTDGTRRLYVFGEIVRTGDKEGEQPSTVSAFGVLLLTPDSPRFVIEHAHGLDTRMQTAKR
jgi:hypothetical protein